MTDPKPLTDEQAAHFREIIHIERTAQIKFKTMAEDAENDRDAANRRHQDAMVEIDALTERVKLAEAESAVLLEMAQGFDADGRDYERINNLAGCENNHWRTQLRKFAERAPIAAAFLAKHEAMRMALSEFVYTTTHLSAEREDGSHDCRVSKLVLEQARAALALKGTADE